VGTYTITLSLAGSADKWAFQFGTDPLVPIAGTTADEVFVSYMPTLLYFATSSTHAGDSFFQSFNYEGAITRLPA